mmetsp:Transcript_25939/g.80787  ORF Transcript_25939/g.80787 Transcript_25939/m.80787 type:complete len:363 (-) Transcript_25939:504-1592(-)
MDAPSPPRAPPFLPAYRAAAAASIGTAGDLRDMDEWLTTRASPRFAAAAASAAKSSFVKRKCERWFVCICTSYPSLVALSSSAMTPALLHSTSSSPVAARTAAAAARTLPKSIRSQSTCVTTVPAAAAAEISARAASARADGRFRRKTFAAPFSAKSLAATSPVPDVQPVTAKDLPVSGPCAAAKAGYTTEVTSGGVYSPLLKSWPIADAPHAPPSRQAGSRRRGTNVRGVTNTARRAEARRRERRGVVGESVDASSTRASHGRVCGCACAVVTVSSSRAASAKRQFLRAWRRATSSRDGSLLLWQQQRADRARATRTLSCPVLSLRAAPRCVVVDGGHGRRPRHTGRRHPRVVRRTAGPRV